MTDRPSPRIQRAADVLLDAYFDSDLELGGSDTCAVGILTQRLCDQEMNWLYPAMAWHHDNETKKDRKRRRLLENQTGFKMDELMRIEAAFEGRPEPHLESFGSPSHEYEQQRKRDDLFAALNRTLGTLHKLDDNADQTGSRQNQAARRRHPQMEP